MDNKVKILLGSEKNINSVNVDNHSKIELSKKENQITEFNVNDVVNATEVFDNERANNPVYRIYGRIEYLSLLNGLKKDYNDLVDFFNPQKTGDFKDIQNSFDFYLVAPANTYYNKISNTNNYRRSFEVLANNNNFEIYNAGFSNNVYGEQVYIFSFNLDFDVSNLYDAFGFPLTELFLYVQYKKDSSKNESMAFIKWSTTTGNKTQSTLSINSFNVGDIIETTGGYDINDIISYNKEEFLQEQIDEQKYYIRTNYKNENNVSKTLEWSYKPFIPFKLRYFDGVVSTAKLSNIVENSTNLSIYNINESGTTININKSLKQNISETIKTITNWDASPSNSNYIWNSTTGIIKFLNSGTYNIKFNTKIYLSDGTDKYIGEIYLEKLTSGGNFIIPKTKRVIFDNNVVEGIIINHNFNAGDRLRVRTRLIPNPEERKLELIPDYATIIEESGKYVWRDIVRQGYIEPISDNGVDYPFFNGRRYLFSPIVFSVVPNLSAEDFDKHQHTIDVFSEISYSDNAITIDEKPITELDDIGKPCL